MFKTPWKALFLLTILIGGGFESWSYAENGPELPADPAARKNFVPGPAPAASQSSFWVHPKEKGTEVQGGAPAVVVFSEIALPGVPALSGPPRSHIQGRVFDVQGGIDLLETAQDRSTEQLEEIRPEVQHAFNKAALGDLQTNFSGLANTGWFPPDTVMAAGPNHVMEAVNSGYAIYTKAGTNLVGYTTFSTFFNAVKPASWAGFMFDPRILYSAGHGKYAMLALGLDQTNMASYYFIAISQTTDPTGGWWIWRFNTDNGFTPDAWLDYAGLGEDSWGVYVTGNYFLWAGGFKYSTVISLNPAMFSGGASNGWQFVDLRWPNNSLAASLQPALPLSVAGGAETFFVNSWSGFGSQINVWTLTGDRTNSPSLTNAVANVSAYSAIGPNVDQPGSTTDIDGGDARVMNVFYSQRRVYTTLGSDPNQNGSSSGAFIAKVNVDSAATEWDTTLTGGVGWYYFYPAVAIGDAISTSPPISVFLSWTNPASTSYASAAAKTYGGPPANIAGPFPVLASGLGPYVQLDSGGRNRWGDYSGAGFDFSTSTMWGAAEAAGSGNTWRTQIAQLRGTMIFSDGFETGTVSQWSSIVP